MDNEDCLGENRCAIVRMVGESTLASDTGVNHKQQKAYSHENQG